MEVADLPGAVDAVDESVGVERVVGGTVPLVVPGEDPLGDGAWVALAPGAPDVVLEVGVGAGVLGLLAGVGRTGCRRAPGAVPTGTGRTRT